MYHRWWSKSFTTAVAPVATANLRPATSSSSLVPNILRSLTTTTTTPPQSSSQPPPQQQLAQENSVIPPCPSHHHYRPPRLSLFSCPADNDRFLRKAFTTLDGNGGGDSASTIVLDLEDGVSPQNKHIARQNVVSILSGVDDHGGDDNNENDDNDNSTNPTTRWGVSPSHYYNHHHRHPSSSECTTELAVRINALDTGSLALDDLQAIIPLPYLTTIVLPKVESIEDLQFVSRLIEMMMTSTSSNQHHHHHHQHEQQQQKQRPPIKLLAAIESASGLLQLPSIASFNNTCQNNNRRIMSTPSLPSRSQSQSTPPAAVLDGLIFASEDYCADVGAVRTKDATELLFARSTIVTTAKAYGLEAIDMVHIDFRDLQALQVESRMGRQMGYTGKQAIHPSQVEIINQQFVASQKDREFALKVKQEYESVVLSSSAADEGGSTTAGAVVVDGIVVDAPVYKWAIKILEQKQ